MNPVSNNHSSPDSSPDLFEKDYLPSAPPVSKKNSKFIDTGSTIQTSIISESKLFLLKNKKNSSVTAQRLLSPIPVPPPITWAITFRPIHIPDTSDIDPPPFPILSPPLTETVARKSKSFNHRKSLTLYSIPVTNLPLLFCKKNLMTHLLLQLHLISKVPLISALKQFLGYIQIILQVYYSHLLLLIL